MDTDSPPIKKICLSPNSALVRGFNPQLPGQSNLSFQTGSPKVVKVKLLKNQSSELKCQMISKDGIQIGKTIKLIKHVPIENGKATPKTLKVDKSPLQLQSHYTTKAEFLPQISNIVPGKQKQNVRRPLILKKNLKIPAKVGSNVIVQGPNPVFKEVKTLTPVISIPEKIATKTLPEQGKIIKSYTRTLKKIGPNMQLLPHDSPDAKTIIDTEVRNGTLTYVQKSLQNNVVVSVNGFPVEQIKTNGLTQKFTIIEQALSSLKNPQLKDKALKALAECRSGNEQPISTRPDGRSVKDSMVQTEVFSLMVPGEFIITSSNCNKIKRQKLIENQELETIDETSKFIRELDLVVKNFGNKSTRVDEVLDKTVPNKILRQIFEDYKAMIEFDEDGLLAIHQAVVSNNLKAVQRLLLVIKMLKDQHLSVDAETRDGSTSLELAIECDADTEIIEALLKAGANPCFNDVSHKSAICLASQKSAPYLNMLLQHTPKTFLDTIDQNGLTCLHYCALNGNVEGAQLLLIKGANINCQDRKSGKTALFIAMENHNDDLTKLFLTFQADPGIANFSGHTVLPLIDNIKSYALRAELHRKLR